MPRKKILIVDENIDCIAFITKLCGKMQVECSSAQDGVIAVNEINKSMKCDSGGYDAIFMDEVFVWQLFKIRRLGFKGPIVGLTVLGNGQTEPTLPLDEQARFDHVLIKPITSKSLLKVVKMIGFVTPLFTFAAANAGAAAVERERIKERNKEKKHKNNKKGVLIKNSLAKPPPKDMVSSGSLDVMLDASGKNAFDGIDSGLGKINMGASSSMALSRKSSKHRAVTSHSGYKDDIADTDSPSPDTKGLRRIASMPNALKRTGSYNKLTKDAHSGTEVVVKKKRTKKKKKKGLQLGFNGFAPSGLWDDSFYSRFTLFLSPEEQEELNAHFRRYAEGEERKKDLYEGYIKGIMLIATKSASKTLLDEMKEETRRRTEEEERISVKSLEEELKSTIDEDDMSSVLSLYNDDGSSVDPSNPLSFEQEMDLKEAFSLFDVNGDGSISQEELCLAMMSTGMFKYGELNSRKQTVEAMIQRLDANDDGRIVYAEFRKAMVKELLDGGWNNDDEKEISHYFENFDADGNGFISPTDFFLYMSDAGAELSIEEVEQMFLLVDKDGDGQISYREFKENMYHILRGQYPELFEATHDLNCIE